MPWGRRARFALALGVSVALLSGLATGAEARGLVMAGGNSDIEIHMGALNALPPASSSEGPVIHLHMPIYRRARIRRPVPRPLAPPLALEAELAAKSAAKPSREITGQASATEPAGTSPRVTVAPAAPAAATTPKASPASKTPTVTGAGAQSAAKAVAPKQAAATTPPEKAAATAPAVSPTAAAATTPAAPPTAAEPATPPEAPPAATKSSGGGIAIGGALGLGAPAPAPPPSQTRVATATSPAAMPAPGPKVALSIPFAANQATLGPKAQTELSKLAAELAGNNVRIELNAYAARSAADGARMLSLTRALAVRAYLMNKGVADTRIDVRALGVAASGPPDRVDIRSLAK